MIQYYSIIILGRRKEREGRLKVEEKHRSKKEKWKKTNKMKKIREEVLVIKVQITWYNLIQHAKFLVTHLIRKEIEGK